VQRRRTGGAGADGDTAGGRDRRLFRHRDGPFVSRDGRFLLFNNSNDPATNTELHFARSVDALHWSYGGTVAGANSAALEGTPTMDAAGRLFFVSTRSYAQTACTIHSARFADGVASDVRLVDSICRHEPGVVNFDVDVDASGSMMTFVDSRFGTNNQPRTPFSSWPTGTARASFAAPTARSSSPRSTPVARCSTRRRSRPIG